MSAAAAPEHWECGECGCGPQDSGVVPRPVLCPECRRPLDAPDPALERLARRARSLASGRAAALLATVKDDPA